MSLDGYVEDLLLGEEGSDVVQKMRTQVRDTTGKPFTLASLKSNVSRVRNIVLSKLSDYRDPKYDDRRLSQYPDAQEFLNASLKDKLRIQRKHKMKKHQTWSAEAEKALTELKIYLPRNLVSFHVTKEEADKVTRMEERNKRKRNRSVVKIRDAAKLHAWAINCLEIATETTPPYKLAIPLCLVTGRRITELTSFRSSFTYADTYAAKFFGQLKKKDGNEYNFELIIPLLCEFTLFDKAHQLLRASLLKKYGDSIKSFTNEEIHNRVNPRIREHFYGFLPPEVPPEVVTRMKQYREGEKIFRKVYLRYVFDLFDHSCSEQELAKLTLGHEHDDTATWYMSVNLQGIGELSESLGPLPFEEEESDSE